MSPTAEDRNPDLRELQIWANYLESAHFLRNMLERRMLERASLSLGDYQVLLALSEAEKHTLRSAALADLVDWERSRLSHHLGRMEKRGLLKRSQSKEAARGVDVTITADGLASFRIANADHLHAIKELFVNAFSAEQIQQAGEVSETLIGHLEEVEEAEIAAAEAAAAAKPSRVAEAAQAAAAIAAMPVIFEPLEDLSSAAAPSS